MGLGYFEIGLNGLKIGYFRPLISGSEYLVFLGENSLDNKSYLLALQLDSYFNTARTSLRQLHHQHYANNLHTQNKGSTTKPTLPTNL